MKKTLILVSIFITIFSCSRNKELFIYTIPGEGLPVIKTVTSGDIQVYTDITDKESVKTITVETGKTIEWSDSCVIVEKTGKGKITSQVEDNVWLYTKKDGSIEGDKEGKISLAVNDDIEILNYQAEGYYTVKAGRQIFDLHESLFEIIEKPVINWYMQEATTELWYLIDGKTVDVTERTF